MSEWKPIETAPKDRSSILVYCDENQCQFESWFDSDVGAFVFPFWGWGGDFNPTHWMELPEPPK